ncbi:MAG: hypothetical protein GY710_18930 [Desulfobacteraceae bacterium]|nr:hypothetical protein [Desulfobacteraceae bacterium]
MITISGDFVIANSEQRESFSCEIPTEEWDTILNFHQNVELLRSTKFVQNKRGGQIAIKYEAGKKLESKEFKIEIDEVWSMLLKLRPFVLNKEKYYFHRIKNLLKRRLTQPAFRKGIDRINDLFVLNIMQKQVRLKTTGREILSIDTVMDWLNSFEYHQDESKREIVHKDLGIFGVFQNGTSVILFALIDMIHGIFALSDLVETLMLIQNGGCSEISCPANFLERI